MSALIALMLTIAICWTYGFRSFWLIGATIVLWLPVFAIEDMIFLRIIPPRFEAYVPEKPDVSRSINL